MQKAILAKDGPDNIGKLVYAGDLDDADNDYTRLVSTYPQFQFVLYQDATDPEFVSAAVSRVVPLP